MNTDAMFYAVLGALWLRRETQQTATLTAKMKPKRRCKTPGCNAVFYSRHGFSTCLYCRNRERKGAKS